MSHGLPIWYQMVTTLLISYCGGIMRGTLILGNIGLILSLALTACQKNPNQAIGLIGEGLMADRPVMKADQSVYLVEFSADPLLVKAQLNSIGVLEPNEDHVALVKSEQSRLEDRLKSLSSEIKILYRYKYILNAFAIVAPTNLEDKIRSIPGVRSLKERQVFSRPTWPRNTDPSTASASFNPSQTSVTHIQAQAAYDQGVRGQGIRIGVLDTGIDYTHSMLGGSGNPEDFKNVDLVAPHPQFPNEKVVGGIDLVGSQFDVASLNPALHIPQPDMNPLDEGGHGTHVAGTIAGIGDGINTYDGVAPDASLYAIKVFGNGSTSDEVVIAGLEWAVDPNQDGRLDDKLHVVNLSLGGSNGTPYELYNKAVTNLSFSGTVVVASAGNSSDIPFIVGSPSTSDEAISVAANIDSSEHNWRFKTVGFHSEGVEFALSKAIEASFTKPIDEAGDLRGELAYVGLADKDFTEEEADFLHGKVALIDRGVVTFEEKVHRAAKAGAIGVIVAQNSDDEPFTMGGDKSADIPAIMISKELGDRLKKQMDQAAVEVLFQNPGLIESPELINQITDFSSRGPRSMDLLIKPEITAPGANIISAAMGEGVKGVKMSGTSMSGPHMAGVMGLLKQKYPRLTSRDLKSLVMSTAVQIKNKDEVVESVARQGAGQVDVSKVLKGQWVSDPASLSLGLQSLEKTKRISRTLRLKSLWDDELNLKVSLETKSPAISLESQEILMKPEGMVDLKLNMTLKASGVPGLEEEVTGWVVLKSSTGGTQKIPFLVRLLKISDVKLSKVDLGAESRLDLEGSQNFFEFKNYSLHSGEAWLFNLLAQDSRKAVSDNPFISRECDIKAVGYRLTDSHLEVGVKFFNRVTVWSLCEVSLLMDKDNDSAPEAELALTTAGRIAGLSGETVITSLLDYPKARELRKKAEEDAKNEKEGPRVQLDLTPSLIAIEEAVAAKVRSTGILRIPLEALRSVVGYEPRIQVIASSQERDNSEIDDYLKDKKKWFKLPLSPEDQSWKGLQSLNLKGQETRKTEVEKGAGHKALLVIYPNNNLDNRGNQDEQIQIYRPRFSEKEAELIP